MLEEQNLIINDKELKAAIKRSGIEDVKDEKEFFITVKFNPYIKNINIFIHVGEKIIDISKEETNIYKTTPPDLKRRETISISYYNKDLWIQSTISAPLLASYHWSNKNSDKCLKFYLVEGIGKNSIIQGITSRIETINKEDRFQPTRSIDLYNQDGTLYEIHATQRETNIIIPKEDVNQQDPQKKLQKAI